MFVDWLSLGNLLCQLKWTYLHPFTNSLLTDTVKTVITMTNNGGPHLVPCGTPHMGGVLDYVALPISIKISLIAIYQESKKPRSNIK